MQEMWLFNLIKGVALSLIKDLYKQQLESNNWKTVPKEIKH